MKSFLEAVTLLVVATGLVVLVGAGCQTSKGFGKDVEKLGEKIQDKAR